MAQILTWRRKSPSVVPLTFITGLPGASRDALLTHLENSYNGSTGKLDLSALVAAPDECLTCELWDAISDKLEEGKRDRSSGFNRPDFPKSYDRLAIVLPDDCDPMALVDSFEFHRVDKPDVRIDGILCVIDAQNFWSDFSKDIPLTQRNQTGTEPAEEEDAGTEVAELLVSQIEFCDVLILVHGGKIPPSELQEIEYTLRMLQPRAEIIRSFDEKIRVENGALSHRFDSDNTLYGASWRRALKQASASFEQPSPMRGTYPSLVFRRRRPLHPERFYQLILDWPETILRTFGTIWLPTRNDLAFSFSQAGPAAMSFSLEGEWIAALPEEDKAYALAERPDIARSWDRKHGDRCTQLVMIGEELDQAQLLEKLEECLLTDWEMRIDWTQFPDPILRGWEDGQRPEEPVASHAAKILRLVYSNSRLEPHSPKIE